MNINIGHNFNSVRYNNIRFKQNNSSGIKHDEENPISKSMEQLDVVKASLIAGLGFGAKAICELVYEDSSVLEDAFNAGQKLAKKNYGHIENSNKRFALGLASSAAIIVGVIGLFAGLYAAFNAPKSMYKGKINAHKKAEEMDVYLASNRIEKDLYEQVDNSAKEATTEEELAKAQSQYMMLKMAKNEIPSFVNTK